MIPFDFDYYRPDTVEKAVLLYHELDAAGKLPVYYGGGTEIISMARVHNLFTKAVIDLKGIPECQELGLDGDRLVIGAGVTLTRISEAKLWPLQAKAGGRIADHTVQGKITMGGNICGTIMYHEAILPLLLTDSEVMVAAKEGRRQVSIHDIFAGQLRLGKGEFLIKVLVRQEYLQLPFVHVKKTKSEKIDYPLLSMAALRIEDVIRVACSGACSFPFRSASMEQALNQKAVSVKNRVQQALTQAPGPILGDLSGSAAYRTFVLANTLENMLYRLEGKNA